MKVLAVAEFDPAGALGGHRRAMRARGIDYRLATDTMYRPPPRDGTPDWNLHRLEDMPDGSGLPNFVPVAHVLGAREELEQFAREADVVQFHPVIGQKWSYETTEFRAEDGDLVPFGGVQWSDVINPKARKVAYFHGSRNLQYNTFAYARHWRSRGFELWASTLDHVVNMGAVYAPPIVDDHHEDGFSWPAAKLRRDTDPLHICQAPTDKKNCHTDAFIDACFKLGVVFDIYNGLEHSTVLRYKARRNCGFDHLRGAFSVNTVENCLIGIVPLVGMSAGVMKAWHKEGLGVLPWPWIRDEANGGVSDLEATIRKLQQNASWHRDLQVDVRRWAANEFGTSANSNRMEKLYHGK